MPEPSTKKRKCPPNLDKSLPAVDDIGDYGGDNVGVKKNTGMAGWGHWGGGVAPPPGTIKPPMDIRREILESGEFFYEQPQQKEEKIREPPKWDFGDFKEEDITAQIEKLDRAIIFMMHRHLNITVIDKDWKMGFLVDVMRRGYNALTSIGNGWEDIPQKSFETSEAKDYVKGLWEYFRNTVHYDDTMKEIVGYDEHKNLNVVNVDGVIYPRFICGKKNSGLNPMYEHKLLYGIKPADVFMLFVNVSEKVVVGVIAYTDIPAENRIQIDLVCKNQCLYHAFEKRRLFIGGEAKERVSARAGGRNPFMLPHFGTLAMAYLLLRINKQFKNERDIVVDNQGGIKAYNLYAMFGFRRRDTFLDNQGGIKATCNPDPKDANEANGIMILDRNELETALMNVSIRHFEAVNLEKALYESMEKEAKRRKARAGVFKQKKKSKKRRTKSSKRKSKSKSRRRKKVKSKKH